MYLGLINVPPHTNLPVLSCRSAIHGKVYILATWPLDIRWSLCSPQSLAFITVGQQTLNTWRMNTWTYGSHFPAFPETYNFPLDIFSIAKSASQRVLQLLRPASIIRFNVILECWTYLYVDTQLLSGTLSETFYSGTHFLYAFLILIG